jgi:hypothetical protein
MKDADMLTARDRDFISKNRDMPDVPETQAEKIIVWLKELDIAGEHDPWGKKYLQRLAIVRKEASKKDSGGGSKYDRALGSDIVVKMMVIMRRWGGHFLTTDAMKVAKLQKIVRVYGGVSIFNWTLTNNVIKPRVFSFLLNGPCQCFMTVGNGYSSPVPSFERWRMGASVRVRTTHIWRR